MVTTVDQYGAPSYGAIGRPPAGIAFHTPENADPTLASALAVARWQAGPTNTSGGSYHGILAHDSVKFSHPIKGCADPTHWTMVRSVPWDQAAGGISTTRDPAIWQPDRYPWIRKMLPAAAFGDPNRWLHQISLSGKAAWYVANGYPPGAVKALAEWTLILERAYKYSALLLLHRHFQTNRSDPGPLTLPDLVVAAWEALVNPPTPAPPAPTPTPTPPPPPPAPSEADVLKGRITKKDAHVKVAMQALTDALEE